jgi:hypothetical protein
VSTLRVEDLIRMMDLLKPPAFDAVLLPAAWAKALPRSTEPAPMFAGMRVIESPDAKMPARVHKRRSGMSEAYHRRVQKKWNKRFGYVPAAFLLNTDMLKFKLERELLPMRVGDLSCFSDPIARMALWS